MTSYRHVTEIREHMVEIRKCCNFWPMFVRLNLGLKMLHMARMTRMAHTLARMTRMARWLAH